MMEVLTLSSGSKQAVTDTLDEKGLDYVISDHTDDSDTSAVIMFPLPADSIEHILNRLRDLEVNDEVYTTAIKPEAIVSDRIGGSKGPYYDEVETVGAQGIARSELHSTAADMLPRFPVFCVLTALSAIVATAGGLLGSVTVLVGSMVIAPLIGPLMTASVATILDDDVLFWQSFRYQLIGLLIGVVSSVVFALLIRSTSFLTKRYSSEALLQMSNHTDPGILLIAVAFSAGIAGAVSISTSTKIELVGVMIAAAIMPPIGIIGIGIVWQQPAIVLGSATVVLINVLSVILTATISLWYMGYHPTSWSELRGVRSTMFIRIVALAIGITLLAVFLAKIANGLTNTHLDLLL